LTIISEALMIDLKFNVDKFSFLLDFKLPQEETVEEQALPVSY